MDNNSIRTTQECYVLFWTNPGNNTLQSAAVRPLNFCLKNHQRRTRNLGHCWRNKGELIGDVLLQISAHGSAKVGRPARMYNSSLRTLDVV